MRHVMLKNITMLLLSGVAVMACNTTSPVPAAKPLPAPIPPTVEKAVSPAAAANMANNCFACHGPNGVSPGSIPSLNVLTARDMADMLKAFKSSERPSTVMGRHAKAYTNTEIEAISGYIASLNRK